MALKLMRQICFGDLDRGLLLLMSLKLMRQTFDVVFDRGLLLLLALKLMHQTFLWNWTEASYYSWH